MSKAKDEHHPVHCWKGTFNSDNEFKKRKAGSDPKVATGSIYVKHTPSEQKVQVLSIFTQGTYKGMQIVSNLDNIPTAKDNGENMPDVKTSTMGVDLVFRTEKRSQCAPGFRTSGFWSASPPLNIRSDRGNFKVERCQPGDMPPFKDENISKACVIL